MQSYPKIGIVYLSFYSELYLDDVASALKKITYPKNRVEFIIVDNPHPEHGSSARYINENLMPLSGAELPVITLLSQTTNLGFAGGNNVGINKALELNCQYVFLHNQDGFLDSNCLRNLVEVVEKDKTIGAAQALVLQYPKTNLINTSGNGYHFLGIGFSNNHNKDINKISLPAVYSIGYASGSAVLLRGDLLKKYGLWDEDYFLYHEDVEYSLRLKALGYKTVAASSAKFFHKYNFSRNANKFYYIERNRLGLIISYYHLFTLIFLSPLLIIWDLAMLLTSIFGGWFKEYCKARWYWCKINNWRLWLGKRKIIQTMRVKGDRLLWQPKTSLYLVIKNYLSLRS